MNAFRVVGDPRDERRAVLIHSLAMDRRFWQPVAERLDGAVLLYDCTGHGESEKPAGPYTVEGFADDLARLLDHIGWDAALLAGASMGGCVALAFAGQYAKRTVPKRRASGKSARKKLSMAGSRRWWISR
jgi:3-oxoadipate enol-lactonase